MTKKKKPPLKEVKMLRDFKEESGWSYEKIAREIGVTQRSVILWLKHDKRPMPLAREAIRAFLIKYGI